MKKWLITCFLCLAALGGWAQSQKEAMFYQKLEDNSVQCQLCPRRCLIPEGGLGFCRTRENRKGKLYTLVYGRLCSVNTGPIEKAPLFHFIPGHRRLCLASASCNLRCKHCQNWSMSQAAPGELNERELSPQELIELAQRNKLTSLCFTYSEPVVLYDYIYDVSQRARERGLKTSIVSNGYINPEPLRELVPYLSAVKIDLKGFSEEFYRDTCEATLAPVLATLKVLKEEGAYFEIVNLVIPTLNDDLDLIKKMCEWIKEELGPDVPLHFSRFTPAYKLTALPATPVKTLEQAAEIAYAAGLNYVYIGNVPGHKYNSTFCPQCQKRLIHRIQFQVLENNVAGGKCKFCGHKIPGVWD